MKLVAELNGYDPDGFANEWGLDKMPDNARLLFAYYHYEDYSGRGFGLLAMQDPKGEWQLYEVNGSHCSCFGLEDQWSPELVNIKELRERTVRGWMFHDTPDDGIGETAASLLNVLYHWQHRFD